MKEVVLSMNEQTKYEVIKELVDHEGGNKLRAAKKLGCTVKHVNRMMAGYKKEKKRSFPMATEGVRPQTQSPKARFRIHGEKALDGKLPVEFAALILREKLHTSLKDRNEEFDSLKKHMSEPTAIGHLEMIQISKKTDGVYRLDHEPTKKTIF